MDVRSMGLRFTQGLGAKGQWEKKAQLWDKECVKKGMQEKGYAKAVVFDPDELSEFKKDVCELYDQTTVCLLYTSDAADEP